jgi:putative ABC transport system substrate-binding protein
LLLAALALAAFVRPALAAGEPAFGQWFHYKKDLEKEWQFDEVPGNPLALSVRRRAAQSGAAVRRVFVLYPRPSSAYDTAMDRILRGFEAKEVNAQMTVVNFKVDNQRGEEALRLAQAENSELIFAVGSESSAWLFEHYKGGKIPVVTVCSKDPVLLGQIRDYDSGSGNNFAFTSLNMPIEAQMTYLRQLKPDLVNLAVLVDSTNTSAVETQGKPIAEYAKTRSIQVLWSAIKGPEKARDELAHVVDDAVRTMRKSDPDLSRSLFWITGSTAVFNEIATINEHADRVPVVSVVPDVVTNGPDTAVIAIGISFESNADVAAVYGANILSGRSKVGELKVGISSPPDIAISFLKAREIGLLIPYSFFETATYVYDYNGRPVRTPASATVAEATPQNGNSAAPPQNSDSAPASK